MAIDKYFIEILRHFAADPPSNICHVSNQDELAKAMAYTFTPGLSERVDIH